MTNERQTCDCGCLGFGPAFTELVNRLGCNEACNHFRAARVEFLKGVRAIIDSRIDYLSKKNAPPATGTTVPVE